MSLKDQLIKLGSTRPDLRTHIRPVLAQLEKEAGEVPKGYYRVRSDFVVRRDARRAAYKRKVRAGTVIGVGKMGYVFYLDDAKYDPGYWPMGWRPLEFIKNLPVYLDEISPYLQQKASSLNYSKVVKMIKDQYHDFYEEGYGVEDPQNHEDIFVPDPGRIGPGDLMYGKTTLPKL